MRKLFVLLSLVTLSTFAEPTFQQVEGLIEQKNFQSAELALEQIISAHPQSAKAFYAMAQAQAGLGNLGKAQYALNKARAIDPDLKFATSSNIQSLEQAITPQVKKIEVVEESHLLRNLFLLLFVGAMGFVIYYFFVRKNDEADDNYRASTGGTPTPPAPPAPESPQAKVDRANSAPLTPAPRVSPNYTAPTSPTYTPAPAASAPTVVNNHYGSNNDGFVTGMLVGNMLSGSHHHDTVVVQQPSTVYVEREVPAKPAKSSWDDDSSYVPATPSRSSTWDDDSSSKRSSSWSSSSDDSSSSSWSSSSSSDSSWSSSDSSSSSSDW